MIGAPDLGLADRGHPDLFRFPRSLPICSEFRSLFRACTDLFRFAPISSDLFSEKVMETRFCRPLLKFASPRHDKLDR